MALPLNDRPSFFKYVSGEVAALVVENRQLRWSSPVLFNDPFDHQAGVHWPFTGSELVDALTSALDKVVFEAADYRPIVHSPYAAVISKSRAIRSRLPRAAMRDDLQDVGKTIAAAFPELCANLNAQVTQHLTSSRVLCLTESHDNVVMWSHYGDQHRGAVFKFRRLAEKDHRFLIAQPVQYTNEPVSYAQRDEYVEHLLGLREVDFASRLNRLAFQKHPDWSYEREWRVHVPLMRQLDNHLYDLWTEPPELFEALYLGCRMEREVAEPLLAKVRAWLPHMEVWRAVKRTGFMALDFERVE